MRQEDRAIIELVHRLDGIRSAEIVLKRSLPHSVVARVAIEHRTSEDDAPSSLFVKLAFGPEYAAEVDFYNSVAPSIASPPLTRCHVAEYLPDSKVSKFVFDDLMASHTQPTDGIPPEQAASKGAVIALAKVHACHWDDPRLGRGIGNAFDDAAVRTFVKDLERDVPEFLDAAANVLARDQKEALEMMLSAAPQIWGKLARGYNLTVTHGDAHWWNFLYPVGPGDVYIFDWQLWHVDLGARDLAFLLALGGFAEPRPELETELLDTYHRTLLSHGVSELTREDLQLDYRWSAIRNLNVAVIFWKQGKHETTWRTTLRRAVESFVRLDCRGLIT